MESRIRHVFKDDLDGLLKLYQHLHRNDPSPNLDSRLSAIWDEILSDKSMHILAVEGEGALVSSCVLLVVRNLTRGARPFGLIENVVTHTAYRRRGYGRRVVKEALAIAWQNGCYKVMIMTGNKNSYEFYKHCGFESGLKTGFVAYPDTGC